MSAIVGVLLCAGRGTRFGGDKRLAPVDVGGPAPLPMAIASVRALRRALDDVVAVVRAGDEDVAALLRDEGAGVVECARADEGMGASLAAGVAARFDAAGWLVALADMPWVEPATVARVAQALLGGASIAAPRFHGRRGHPVGFSASHRESLVALRGDEGARSVVAANPDAIAWIDVDDPGVLRDVDVRESLESRRE